MRKGFRRLRSGVLRITIPILTQTLGRMPLGAQRLAARALGFILWHTNRRYRQRSLEHLAIAFPNEVASDRENTCRESFRQAAMNALEALTLLAGGADRMEERLNVKGWQHVQASVDKGERILLLTCHSGFWELLGLGTARQDLPLYAIGRRPDEPVFADVVERLRRAVKVRNIERGSRKGRSLLRQVLKGEGALAMLIDQDTKVEGTWVPFFDRPAFTPTGAAEMAIKHKMRVFPAFMERTETGHHLLKFQTALPLGNDVTEATATMTLAIEEHIRRRPAQWVWWHRRWRRQPPAQAESEL